MGWIKPKKHLTLLSLYAVEQRKHFIYCCDLPSAHILEEAKNMLHLTLSLLFSTSQNPYTVWANMIIPQ